jgi:hypothetical protein
MLHVISSLGAAACVGRLPSPLAFIAICYSLLSEKINVNSIICSSGVPVISRRDKVPVLHNSALTRDLIIQRG